MRFIKNGPSIPDELLVARDQGRVVFFCGAGVSQAKAGLPDFFGLAKKVTNRLGVAANSSALKILDEAREIETRTGVAGLISADRIFSLLERDFLVADIEAAVASALKPDEPLNLIAHNTLLDLATTREGTVRLVTTNFDRLFDECGRNLPSWQPPRLPEPSHTEDMHGIVYLHGKVTPDYRGAEGDGFVLSSSEFGRAYLSDSWATSFFREIIERYVVVFVGYTADDPPVHYLLEALNKTSGKLEGVYAFQSGSAEDATSRWFHKGVGAIPYDASDEHLALWRTLEAWAHRARNPDQWCSEVIENAKQGPEKLLPHERGQVAHIVSTIEGLRKFSESDEPPPADWLCVFDPDRRYAKPGNSGNFQDRRPYVDPFDLYCIDSDTSPSRIDPEDHYGKREVFPGSWDAFAPNHFDRISLGNDNFASLRGHWSSNMPRLPSRLGQMGVWISKVADQPAAVWWAAHQKSLHPDIRNQVRWALERSQRSSSSEVRKAWRYLFEHWEKGTGEFHRDLYELGAEIAKDGWSPSVVRKFAAYSRPYLKVEHNFFGGPKPPDRNEEISLEKLIRLDVVYPDSAQNIAIPDEWVASVVVELRKNLEIALGLENEIGGYGLSSISPIVPDDDPDGERYGRIHGLSGAVIRFSSVFERLLQIDSVTAKREFSRWLTGGDTIFAQLRIWAASKPELVPDDQFGIVFANLGDKIFWDNRHARDLLLTLSSRWNSLSADTRIEIETRLLNGPSRWEQEDDEHFEERRAWSTVNRITWLSRNGCELHLDLEAETERLRVSAPKWKPEYADKAAESLEGRIGWVRTETEHSALLGEPLASTLSKALELSGRRDNFLVEHAPYAGLSVDHPVRAFAALRMAAKWQDFPEWAWRTFLNSEARKSDNPKFVALIAEQLARYSNDAIATFIRPAADWFSTVSKILAVHYPKSFDRVASTLIRTLATEPQNGASAIVRGNKEPDWTMEAINAPTGKVAEALLNNPRTNGLKIGEGFPPDWSVHVDALLALAGDLRRHALVIFTHNLNWFYAIDSEWSEKNLLSVLDANDLDDKDAFWGGFFWGAGVPNQKLYMRLKPHLLQLAKQGSVTRRGHGEVLSGIILAGWGSFIEGTSERCICGDELRDVLVQADDEFRSRILWQAERWSSGSETKDGTENEWASLLSELLRDVWPRQKSAKSPTISARLCDLAFSNKKRFPELAEIVLPLLTKIDRNHLMLPNLRQSKNNIVDLYPRQTLALLYAVLPDNVSAWPYGIEETLMRIAEADSALTTDERFLELKRKWDSR